MTKKQLKKIIKEQIEKLNEDSLEDSYSSLNFSKRMYKNASDNKLPSLNYWKERIQNAGQRIQKLKSKGEKLDSKISKNIENFYSEKSFKDFLKHPKIKQTFTNLKKNFLSHLTQKSVVDHSKHFIHKFNHNVEKHFKDFKKHPKQSIINSGKATLNFFKSSAKGITTLDDIGKNLYSASKNFVDKKMTKFSDEEKQLLKVDPDRFIKSLTNNLTKNEIKDFKNLGKTIFYGSWGLSFGLHVGHLGSALTQGFSNLMASKSMAAEMIHQITNIGGEAVKNHVLGAVHQGLIDTVYGNIEPILEQKTNIDSTIQNLGVLTIATYPLVKYFTEDENGKKLFLQALENISNLEK